jgi:hypothetical protein
VKLIHDSPELTTYKSAQVLLDVFWRERQAVAYLGPQWQEHDGLNVASIIGPLGPGVPELLGGPESDTTEYEGWETWCWPILELLGEAKPTLSP